MKSTFVSTDSPSAESHTWLTPLPFVHQLGQFDLDPCAYPNHNTASKLICLPDNGLEAEWNGRIWLNPPYGKFAKTWLTRLANHENGIALIFARLETAWLRPFLRNGFFVVQKRISFISDRTGYKGNAGCASILIPFGRKNIGAILMSDIEGDWFQ